MTNTKKIAGTTENWESRILGADEKYAKPSTDKSAKKALNDSLGMQMISIRFQKSLLEELKMIADINGIGYQPLIKQVLQRFVDAEKKDLLRKKAADARGEDLSTRNGNDEPPQSAAG
ncbi:hypothetical protein IB286_13280 [Spongiibacter sp. KMU-158]|uniref:Uncharacterized protein n=1 Tax=Spongiibacter pelagi TaxID=2760804 RepID=A0A927C5W5_9GAMM|nr:hypothetical protein [Spongiibacter pelagi]MBD2859975.1 hypothetical protein [Spongiibacter pelagi]